MQVLMGHFTIFQSHGSSGWFVPKIVSICQSYGQNTICSFFLDTLYIVWGAWLTRTVDGDWVVDVRWHRFNNCHTHIHIWCCVSCSSFIVGYRVMPQCGWFSSRTPPRLSFSSPAVRIWNSLPQHITSAPSLPVFCCRLKTYFFELRYP